MFKSLKRLVEWLADPTKATHYGLVYADFFGRYDKSYKELAGHWKHRGYEIYDIQEMGRWKAHQSTIRIDFKYKVRKKV
jgi:hypothetical protein